ncbi:unnamed protein product, partial [Didymodactylos carnosus]
MFQSFVPSALVYSYHHPINDCTPRQNYKLLSSGELDYLRVYCGVKIELDGQYIPAGIKLPATHRTPLCFKVSAIAAKEENYERIDTEGTTQNIWYVFNGVPNYDIPTHAFQKQ